jgi:hypothetical protein
VGFTALSGLVGYSTEVGLRCSGWAGGLRYIRRLYYCIVYTATLTEGYNTAGGPGATLLKVGYTEAGELVGYSTAGGPEGYTTEGGLH